MTPRRSPWPGTTGALLAGAATIVLVTAGCGDSGTRSRPPPLVLHPSADCVEEIETRARRHLAAAQEFEDAAAARHQEGRDLLAAGRRADAESALLDAGRLYESAAEERRRAYDEGDAARAASSAEIRRSRASAATNAAPGAPTPR